MFYLRQRIKMDTYMAIPKIMSSKISWSKSKQNEIVNCYLDGIDSDFSCIAEQAVELKV